MNTQKQAFISSTAKRKDKRAIATNIILQVSQSTPSGRFLIEDTNASKLTTTRDLVAAAGGGVIETLRQIESSNVHPSIMKRVWIVGGVNIFWRRVLVDLHYIVG